MKSIIWLALSICVMTFALAACNTVKGVGQDIQSAGEAGEDVIEDLGE